MRIRGLLSSVILLMGLGYPLALWAQSATSQPSTSSSSSSQSSPSQSSSSQAATPNPSKGTAGSTNVLDFDADVIEGERTGPSIMVQMDLQGPNLDTLVFQRKNFNDFHAIDMKRKPKFRGKQ